MKRIEFGLPSTPLRVAVFWTLLFGLATVLGAGWAALPIVNPYGATLNRVSPDASSGDDQTNPNGATTQISGAFDASVDTTSPNGAKAFIGHVDPIPLTDSGANPTWREYN